MVERHSCKVDMVVRFYQKAPIKYIITLVLNRNIMWLGIVKWELSIKGYFVGYSVVALGLQ